MSPHQEHHANTRRLCIQLRRPLQRSDNVLQRQPSISFQLSWTIQRIGTWPVFQREHSEANGLAVLRCGRKRHAGGRPQKKSACAFCQQMFPAKELRSHLPECRREQVRSFIGKLFPVLYGNRGKKATVVSVTRQLVVVGSWPGPRPSDSQQQFQFQLPLRDCLQISRETRREVSHQYPSLSSQGICQRNGQSRLRKFLGVVA